MSTKYARLATSPRIAQLLADQPDYTDATDRLKRLNASAHIPAPGDPHERLVAAIVDNDGTIPHGFLALAEQASVSERAWHIANEAVTRARDELSSQLEDVLRQQWDSLLAKLHAELAEVVTEAAKFTRLEQLDDADSAIAAGRVKDYQRWQTLLSRHREIRTTQSALLQAESDHGNDALMLREVAYIRNVEDAFEQWPAWRRHGYLENSSDPRDRKALTPPWPLDPTANPQRMRPADAAAPEFLRWALENDVALWVPTRPQLADELDRLNDLIRPGARQLGSESRPPAPGEYVAPGAPRRARGPLDLVMDQRA